MQLILRPVSNAQLKEITVTDGRFVIGRDEDYFKSYDRSVTKKLSRQHARIFERDGLMFIADLDSSNGTTVNGKVVKGQPVQLNLNDEVQFGELRYRVELLLGDETRLASEQPAVNARIVLTPKRTDGILDPIVVTSFPFLVGRSSDVFARYHESIPKQLSLISNAHAKFFLRENAVYIQDLGSTNGTTVCGDKLTQQPRKLENHDTISFADDQFDYTVQIYVGDSTVVEANAQIENLSEGTIFVDDATNFFEVYMGTGEKDVDAQNPAIDSEADEGAENHGRSLAKKQGKLRRFFSELRAALRRGRPIDRGLRWTIVASLVALAVGIVGYWYVAWPAQQIDRRIDSGQYEAAAQMANRYLGQRPDNVQLQKLATEATLNAYVPDWQAAIGAGDYAAGSQVLAMARRTGSNNSQDDELIGALELAVEISKFEPSTDSQGTLIDTLSGDETVRILVEQWDSRRAENRRALLQIERTVSGFDAYQTDFYRSLRALRERARDLAPGHQLRANIASALSNRNTIKLRQSVEDFSNQHPDIDLELLAEDVARYEAVEQDILETKWLRAYDRANRTEFNTAPFAVHLDFMNDSVLPDMPTREAYARVAQLWTEGNTLDSFGLYEELAVMPWGEDAQRDLEQKRELLNAIAELLDNPDADNFEDRLFTLFGQLDPARDAFLHAALRPDFQRHRVAALERANDRTGRARQSWNEYEQSGRLQGVHRLEEHVSPEYTRLSGLLTAAYQDIRESELIYLQLDAPSPDGWVNLNRDIIQEIKLQTEIVANLLVIDADIRETKLDLLPTLHRTESR